MSDEGFQFDLSRSANEPARRADVARAASQPPRLPVDPTTVDWADLAPAAPAEEAGFSPLVLWHGFRRRWVLAIGLGIIGSALGGVAGWFLLEPEFTATGYLRVASREPRLVNFGAQTEYGEFDIYKRTQKELILGRYVLNTALRSPKAAEIPRVRDHLDPVAWLAKQIKVDFPGAAEIMTISMSGESATEIATLVNAVVDAYQQEVVLVEKNQRMEKLNTLDKVARDAEEKARRGRADLRRLAETLGTGDSQALTLRQQIALQRYATMLSESTRVHIELMQAEINLTAIQAKQEGAEGPRVPASATKRYLDSHPHVVEHRARLKQAEQTLSIASGKAAPGGEKYLAPYRQQVEEAKQALAEAEQATSEDAQALLKERIASENDAEIGQAEYDVVLLKAQQASLQKELESLSDEANKIGRSSIDVEMMRAEIARIDAVANRLDSEIENIRVDLQSPARITLLSRAEVPAFKDNKKQVRGTAGLAGVWFVLPLLGIAWLESRSHRVYAAADRRHLAGLRVLGALPYLSPTRRRRRAAAAPDQRALQSRMAFRESIDGLRTVLLREAEFGPAQVIMVTSASGGEGKTSVASQLALSLARARRRTLLVDFDLRRPAAHNLLELPADRGVCEVLRGECGIDDALQATDAPHLSFVAAGTFDDDALVALTHEELPQFLAKLRERFDFVILDSSPILPVVDAVLVGKHADAVVMSVLCDVSRRPAIESAYARLGVIGARVLGAVVTGPQDSLIYDAGTYKYLSVS